MDQIKSWKTTIIGFILLIAGVYLLVIGKTVEGGICLTSSLGFFAAKDSTVTGVGSSAITEHEISQELQNKNHITKD